MKIYVYFLKGTQVNHSYTCKPKWFVALITKYVVALRVWRLQICVRY